jgi:hypothetical protein
MADQHFEPTTSKPDAFLGRKLGVTMTAISILSTRSAREARAHDDSPKTVVLFCCFGLVASLSLMTFGIDLSAGWL